MDKLNIFFRITKVDMTKRTVEGIATAELPDQSGEICDYASTKPFYQKWSDGIKKASGGKSLGNVRAMHSNIAAGKVTDLNFDDVNKAIRITAKIVDDTEWNKVVEGVYTGFSQGGNYVRKWQDPDGDHMRYTADPVEVSIVDSPCLAEATFEVIKAEGAVEMRKFHVKPVVEKKPVQKWETTDGKTFEKKNDAIEHQAKIDADEFAEQVVGRIKKSVEEANETLDKRETTETEAAPVAETLTKEAPKYDIKAMLKSEEVWDCRTALEALCAIEWLIAGEMMEGESGGEQMADLKAACDRLKTFIASEIMENTETVEASVQADDLAKAEDMEHVHAIHKAAAHIMSHAMKCMGKDMEMFVKTVGEEMADHIEKIHKKAAGICDKCMKMGSKFKPEADGDDDGDEGAVSKMTKALAQNGALTKALSEVNDLVGKLSKRIEHLEKQPAPRKGSVFLVKKDEGHEADSGEKPVETVSQSINLEALRLSPEEQRRFAFGQ